MKTISERLAELNRICQGCGELQPFPLNGPSAVIEGYCYPCGQTIRAAQTGVIFIPLMAHSIGKHEIRVHCFKEEDIPAQGLMSYVDHYGVTVWLDCHPHASWADVPRFTDFREANNYVAETWPQYQP